MSESPQNALSSNGNFFKSYCQSRLNGKMEGRERKKKNWRGVKSHLLIGSEWSV